ncbi:MAG TPA: hypothetical protein VJB13_03315 [Candidatus Nanoarchaeia archaeon]|nr:hypothetical protein [Candidatus Nanoarchaeia archaeon]
MRKNNIQNQFRIKIGEVAYTANQIRNMLAELGIAVDSKRILNYVKDNDLSVKLEQFDIKPIGPSSTKYWIPKSKLVSIIEGMNIPASVSNLEDAAYKLKYQL